MGQLDKSKTIALRDLLVTSLAQKDAVAKLLCSPRQPHMHDSALR